VETWKAWPEELRLGRLGWKSGNLAGLAGIVETWPARAGRVEAWKARAGRDETWKV